MTDVANELLRLRVEIEVLKDHLSTVTGALDVLLKDVAVGIAHETAADIRQSIIDVLAVMD